MIRQYGRLDKPARKRQRVCIQAKDSIQNWVLECSFRSRADTSSWVIRVQNHAPVEHVILYRHGRCESCESAEFALIARLVTLERSRAHQARRANQVLIPIGQEIRLVRY